MNSLGIYENACRICLADDVILNWNIELFEFCDLTYKDCYFKFTRLDESDSFSSLLCKKCSTELKNAHLLCEKALESYKILKDTLASHNQTVTEFTQDKSHFLNFRRLNKDTDLDLNGSMTTETIVEITQVGAESNKILEIKTITESKASVDVESEIEDIIEDENAVDINVERVIEVEDYTEVYNSDSSLASSTSEQKLIPDTLDDVNENSSDIKSNVSCEKNNAGASKKKKTLMCAYCSKTAFDISDLRRHEAIHDENRIRTEACPDCGLKLYDRRALYEHLKIHTANRTKNYQCEFCDKAYYRRGSLNVHRRIHLGQMVECQICKREFYRQVDLDKHLLKHSATRIQKDVKKHKYLVNCKECNNQIAVVNWKAHKASHLNQPQMKCKICNREFYGRRSCAKHLRIVHKKTRDEYDSFMHYYVDKTEMRTSHLMLKQQGLVQPAVD